MYWSSDVCYSDLVQQHNPGKALARVVFCQAEDGIRDIGVTGVQTCALPIFECRLDSTSEAAWEDCEYPAEYRNLSPGRHVFEIGRASCRERVKISVVAASLKKSMMTMCANRPQHSRITTTDELRAAKQSRSR